MAAINLFVPAITELSAARPMQTVTFFNRQYYNLRTIASFYGFRLSFRSNIVYMTGKYHNFSFTPEKMNASFNGVQITLCHAIYSKNGTCSSQVSLTASLVYVALIMGRRCVMPLGPKRQLWLARYVHHVKLMLACKHLWFVATQQQ